jgi:hypothetical protein
MLMKELLSIALYLLLLVGPFALYLLFPSFWRLHRVLFYFVAYTPVAIFASLRGNVGTDTENYRDAYDLFDTGVSPTFSIDYLFNLLIYVCKVLGLGFQGFSAVHSFLCLMLFSYGAGRVDKVAPVLGLGILPVLIVDATFNGLRYGLAFAAAAVCIHFYYRSTSWMKLGFLVVPGLIHSSLLPLLAMAPVVLVVGVAYLFTIDLQSLLYFSFFADKAESYSEFQRPSGFSGLIPLISFCILFLASLANKNSLRIGFNLGFIAIGIFLSGVFVASQSYAGLRIMQVGVFLFAIHVAQTAQPEFERTTVHLAILLGLIGALNFLRQIFLVGPDGGVVFYPYVFH